MPQDILIFLVELLVSSSLFLFFQTKTASVLITQKKNFNWFLVIVIILQIIAIAILKKEAGDVRLFSSAGWFIRQGQNFYFIDQGSGQYPFFPFLIFFHSVLNWFDEILPLFTFSFYLKLFILLPSLYFLSSQIKERINQLQFLTHPLTYMIVLYHGQIDVILLAFFVGSIIVLNKNTGKGLIKSGFLYSLSILCKTWSIVFIPAIVKLLGKPLEIVKYFLIVLLTIFIDVFIYTRIWGSSFRQVFQAVGSAGGSPGIWGITFIFPFIKTNPFLIFTLLFILLQIIILRKNYLFWQMCLLTILAIYLIIPKWGIQYLFWVLPFLYLAPKINKSREMLLFTILGSLYAFVNYLNIIGSAIIVKGEVVNFFGLLLWGFFLYWFCKLILNYQSPK